KPGNHLDVSVSLDGYFLKRYLDSRSQDAQVMPLVMGRTIQLEKPVSPNGAKQAPSITALADFARDGTGPPIQLENPLEYWGYWQTIRLASRTADSAFIHCAKSSDYVTFSHLDGDPKFHRGRVVAIKGRLNRLFEMHVPEWLKKQGLTRLYEGWVF